MPRFPSRILPWWPHLILILGQDDAVPGATVTALLQRELHRARVPGVQVVPATLRPTRGLNASNPAYRVASSFGVSLQTNAPATATADLVNAADLIIAVDDVDEVRLMEQFPEARTRVVQVGSLDPRGEGDATALPTAPGTRSLARYVARLERCTKALFGSVTWTAPAGPPSPGLARLVARKVLTQPWLLERAASLSTGQAAIFLLHRFSDSPDSIGDMSVQRLHDDLEWLRRHRYHLAALEEILGHLQDGRPIPPRTVLFTVDDGHADLHQLASPVFARFDCPVAVFVVSDFIDRRRWMWWDAVRYAFSETSRPGCRLELDNELYCFAWGDDASRRLTAEQLADRLKWLPASERDLAIGQLLTTLEVSLPARPEGSYAALSWEEIRKLRTMGMSFGPHSTTHPVLAMEDEATSRFEIANSWSRLKEEVPDALPVFCFPNGDRRSFGPREERLVADVGLRAGLSSIPGYVSSPRVRPSNGFLGTLPRFPIEADLARFVQVASGIDRLKARLRRESLG